MKRKRYGTRKVLWRGTGPRANARASVLDEIIDRVASDVGCPKHEVALTLSYFFERLIEAVADGKVVMILGLGKFAVTPKTWRGVPHMRMRFAACAGVLKHIRENGVYSEAVEREFQQYRRRQGVPWASQLKYPIYKTHADFRNAIMRQLVD